MSRPEEVLISQAELARLCEVSRAAVTQWKDSDVLTEAVFTKPGKTGKLRRDLALRQVAARRDLGQALGNGLGTRTEGAKASPSQSAPRDIGPRQSDLWAAPETAPAAAPKKQPAQRPAPLEPVPPAVPPDPAPPEADPWGDGLEPFDDLKDQMMRARLEMQLRRNRIEAAQEAEQKGRLMPVQAAQMQMEGIARQMMESFEGALPDLAVALSARFSLPERDVVHVLKAEFTAVRARLADRAAARAAAEPAHETVLLEEEPEA